MCVTHEQRVRQLLNLIWLGERCLKLAGATHADRADWAAEAERARRELAQVGPGAELPDELAAAVERALGGAPARPAVAGAVSMPSVFHVAPGRRTPPALHAAR